MDLLSVFGSVFAVSLEPMNLLFCFFGCLFGTFVGVLPGIGPAATIAMLIPLTYTIPPETAVIMLAAIYYGANYGGSTTSILLNIPGEASSVVTCLDGYQMAKKGRGGAALGIAAFGSFIAGTFATIMIMLLAPPLSKIALKFGPPEYVGLICMGLTLVTYLSTGSMVKALASAMFGLLLSFIGTDLVTARTRFTFGSYWISEGLENVAIAMGLFGISEVLLNLKGYKKVKKEVFKTQLRELLPNKQDWKDSAGALTRGSIFGFFIGIIPGGGGIIAAFLSYAMEKRVAKHPETFGTGDIRGVAGPESANNAAVQGAMVPLLTMGIPCNVVTALFMGALILHNVSPGPRMITEYPRIFWGVIGAMYTANVMLVILNLPLIRIWVKLLKVPYSLLFPFILIFCLIGAYTNSNSVVDIYVMIIFGIIGYLMKKYEYPPAPLILAFILGPMFEQGFRQSLLMSNNSWLIFINRPISAFFLAIAAIFLLSPIAYQVFGRQRLAEKLPDEED